MAIVTRYNGDANGIVNMDISLHGLTSNATIISTGLTKHPTAFKVTANVDVSTDMGVGGSVETVLRRVGVESTIVMYQVDATQISVLVEATGFDAANLQTALNTPTISTVYVAGVANVQPLSFTVSSTNGFKLA